MKIYISEFTISPDIDRNPGYDRSIELLLNYCKKKGFAYFRSNVFDSYSLIEERIHESDILIAFVDKYWTSSTWKLHELCFACGIAEGMGDKKIKAGNITTIIFLFENITLPLLENLTDTEVFSNFSDVLQTIDKMG